MCQTPLKPLAGLPVACDCCMFQNKELGKFECARPLKVQAICGNMEMDTWV